MKIFLFLIIVFITSKSYAACDDQPSNDVDWTNCNFVENLDLSGAGLANSEMSGVNLSLSNFEKSIYEKSSNQARFIQYRLVQKTIFALLAGTLVVRVFKPIT